MAQCQDDLTKHDTRVVTLVAYSPSWAALLSHRQCPLTQVDAHPAMTLDLARIQNPNKQLIMRYKAHKNTLLKAHIKCCQDVKLQQPTNHDK